MAEGGLRDDLADDVVAALAGLGDLPLVELSGPAQRLRPRDEPAPEARQRRGRVGSRHDLDHVEGVLADVRLDPVEVVKEDRAQPVRRHDLLGELAAQVGRLDPLPGPRLRELLVCGLVEQRAFSHRLQPEEPVALRLAAVEEQERRRGREVAAAGVVDELPRRPVERSGRVELFVAFDLAEHHRRVADQVEAVVPPGRAPAPQPPDGERALLEEVLAVGLRARPARVSERLHVGLEERRMDVGLGEASLLVLGDVQAWQADRRHGPRPPTVGRRIIRIGADRAVCPSPS
jgi:hypothetical protein